MKISSASQVYIDLTHSALQQGSGQEAGIALGFCTVQADRGSCATAITPMKNFLCIKVYIDLTQVHCSRVQGKMPVLLCAAVQFKLTGGLVLLQLHL